MHDSPSIIITDQPHIIDILDTWKIIIIIITGHFLSQ